MSLYEKFYDRPVCLPKLLASELSGDAMSDPVHQQVPVSILLNQKPMQQVQCFDAVGWVVGRASGL